MSNATGLFSSLRHGVFALNRDSTTTEPPPRRFHTIHAAAGWIETHWPDFDLEAAMLVGWRGES